MEIKMEADGALVMQLTKTDNKQSLNISINSYDRHNDNKSLSWRDLGFCFDAVRLKIIYDYPQEWEEFLKMCEEKEKENAQEA